MGVENSRAAASFCLTATNFDVPLFRFACSFSYLTTESLAMGKAEYYCLVSIKFKPQKEWGLCSEQQPRLSSVAALTKCKVTKSLKSFRPRDDAKFTDLF